MKITWTFADETTSEVEVSAEWGTILVDLDRQEYNNDHKETRRHYRLDACAYEGEDFAVEDTALTAINERDDRITAALEKLSSKQREVIKALFYEGLTQKEYARLRGISIAAVSKMYRQATKKLREIL